jgi:hypothetical protein
MTPDKKKALQVYALGLSVVLLCLGAAYFNRKNACETAGGKFSMFSCEHPTSPVAPPAAKKP